MAAKLIYWLSALGGGSVGDSTPGGILDAILLEDGTFGVLMEDDTSDVLMES